MGDDQRCPAAGRRLDAALNRLFRLESSAEVASSKIQDRRVLQQGAGDRDTLLFAAGELEAALADTAVVASRQLCDEIVELCRPGSGLDFGIAGIRAAVADVVANRVVEQHRILRHDADRLAQTGLTQLADFRPSIVMLPLSMS